jgi:hypothetical protein
MFSRNGIVLSSTIAALISVTSSVADAAPYDTNALALQVRAATVHAPIPPRAIYQSSTAGFRIEARFSFGSRTPFVENLEPFFALSSIESGEAYEVRIFLVDTRATSGGTGTGGMGPAPGPGGGGFGTTCSTGLDLPWSFSRSRIDLASETAAPILGPWTGWIPANIMRDMVYSHLSSICPGARLAEIQQHFNMNGAAIVAGLQAYMADPHVDDFDAAFAAVALGRGKTWLGQFWNGLHDDLFMIAREAEHAAAEAEQEIEMIDDQMAAVPCAAPPNQLDADRCKALEDRMAAMEKKFEDNKVIQADADAKAADAKAKALEIQNVQIIALLAGTVCAAAGDAARGYLTYRASKGAAKYMPVTINVDATVSALCITAQMLIFAYKPAPLSAAIVLAQMARGAILYGVDAWLLFSELGVRIGQCAGAPPCISALNVTYYGAFVSAGAILIGSLALATYVNYDKAVAPNLPW